MKVLAYIEQRDGKLKPAAFEALTVASRIAGSASDVAAVIVGAGVKELAAELSGFGADKAYVIDDAAFAHYNPMNHTSAVEAAAKEFGAELIVGCATPTGRDIFPRLAARLDAPIATDITSIEEQGSDLIVKKPMFAGKCISTIKLSGSGVKLVTVRPNVFGSEKSGQGESAAHDLSVSAATESGITTKEVRKGASEKPDLTEATIIVSGGRAMGNSENFGILSACADVLGATVGASRAAVDSGYASHDMQVGQTGKTVNPNLYVACGISGSIQHMAGMRTSKVIVAVNTDPEAPIFGVADYGIVADLFEAVPIMTEKFKDILN